MEHRVPFPFNYLLTKEFLFTIDSSNMNSSFNLLNFSYTLF